MPEGEGETTTPSRPVSRLSDADAEQDIAEQDIAEHYCFAPTHAPLKVIRDTLYDSPELCNAWASSCATCYESNYAYGCFASTALLPLV